MKSTATLAAFGGDDYPPGMTKRAWMCWSSGKDSAYSVHTLRQSSDVEVVGLLTTVTLPYDRVAMHGVRRVLLERQAAALGLPLFVVEIPSECSNATYEEKMAEAVNVAKEQGVQAMAFGDLFLRDIREYRERMLADTRLEPLFPLWDRPTAALAREMVDAGLRAIVTCLDPRVLPKDFAGRRFDHALLDALPSGIDPCAERGEFHTFCYAGPMFRAPIDVEVGETVERDGFVFADLLPHRRYL